MTTTATEAHEDLLNALDRYARSVGLMGLDDDALVAALNAATDSLHTR